MNYFTIVLLHVATHLLNACPLNWRKIHFLCFFSFPYLCKEKLIVCTLFLFYLEQWVHSISGTMSTNDASYRWISLCICIRRWNFDPPQRSVWQSKLPSAVSTYFLSVGTYFQSSLGRKDEQVSIYIYKTYFTRYFVKNILVDNVSIPQWSNYMLYRRFNVIPILADILSDSVKEKVTRIILAVFRVSRNYWRIKK